VGLEWAGHGVLVTRVDQQPGKGEMRVFFLSQWYNDRTAVIYSKVVRKKVECYNATLFAIVVVGIHYKLY